jgi:hypothetical protein
VTCEIAFDVIRWDSLGLRSSVPRPDDRRAQGRSLAAHGAHAARRRFDAAQAPHRAEGRAAAGGQSVAGAVAWCSRPSWAVRVDPRNFLRVIEVAAKAAWRRGCRASTRCATPPRLPQRFRFVGPQCVAPVMGCTATFSAQQHGRLSRCEGITLPTSGGMTRLDPVRLSKVRSWCAGRMSRWAR